MNCCSMILYLSSFLMSFGCPSTAPPLCASHELLLDDLVPLLVLDVLRLRPLLPLGLLQGGSLHQLGEPLLVRHSALLVLVRCLLFTSKFRLDRAFLLARVAGNKLPDGLGSLLLLDPPLLLLLPASLVVVAVHRVIQVVALLLSLLLEGVRNLLPEELIDLSQVGDHCQFILWPSRLCVACHFLTCRHRWNSQLALENIER